MSIAAGRNMTLSLVSIFLAPKQQAESEVLLSQDQGNNLQFSESSGLYGVMASSSMRKLRFDLLFSALLSDTPSLGLICEYRIQCFSPYSSFFLWLRKIIWECVFNPFKISECFVFPKGRKSMKQRDIGDTDHSLPDQRQPGNEHAQCHGWGNRDNLANGRTDCGTWIGKKLVLFL